jgi:tellurite resistance protein TerC
MLSMFKYLKHGVALILFFVAVKMLIMHYIPIHIGISLGVIFGTLVLSVILSIIVLKREQREQRENIE